MGRRSVFMPLAQIYIFLNPEKRLRLFCLGPRMLLKVWRGFIFICILKNVYGLEKENTGFSHTAFHKTIHLTNIRKV